MFNTPEPKDQSQGDYAKQLCYSLEKAYSVAREKLQTAAQCQKMNYDQRIHGEPFKVGDLVYLHSSVIPKGKSRKLHCPWTGPFSVIKRISDNVYRIQDVRNKKKRQVVHFDRLKPCHPNTEVPERNTVKKSNHSRTSNRSANPLTPGANLQLLEDYDDDTVFPSMVQPVDSTQQTPPR